MYKKILIPVDGSTRAERILPHVRELATKFDSELCAVQVIVPQYRMASLDSPYYMQVLVEELEQIESEAKSYLEQLKNRLRADGLNVRTHIAHGPVVESLLQIAKDEDVDLIALSSHGRTGLSRVYYGSIASGILHRSDRPLLLIRADDE